MQLELELSMADSGDFFRDQLPTSSWPIIPTVLRTAYAAARELAESNPILQVESARDNHGRVVSWAVDFGLKRAVDSGSLPCECRWREFAKPTGRYLEMRFSHSTASVSQVEDPKRQPRNVVFRENKRLQAPSLFPEFEESEPLTGAPHFILVHGYQNLSFAHFGAPSSVSKREWTWLSRNLMNIPHEIASDLPGAEDTDVNLDELNLLKEDIERWIKDNGGL